MTESSIPHPIAAAVVALSLLVGVGYGVYHHHTASKANEQLEETLFAPYFAELAQGHIDQAWQRYTTPRYKRQFPLPRYREHWQAALHSGGLLKRNLAVANGAYQVADQHQYTTVQYQLTLADDYVQAVYEIVPDDKGNPRIDWTGRHHTGSSLTAPEPW